MVVFLSNPPLSYSKMGPNDLLDSGDLMRRLDISLRQIYRWIESGELKPFRRVGREFFFRKKDVDKFSAIRRPPGRPPKAEKIKEEPFLV